MNKIVVYCGTRNVYPVMESAAKSLLYHTPVDRIHFMIEDDEFPAQLPDIITTTNVLNQPWFPSSGANYNSSWTYMAYIRLALTKLLPDAHSVLYLDTDTLVLQDISDIFRTDISGYLFGMVQEDIGDIPLELCRGMHCVNNTLLPFQTDAPRPAYCVRPYYNSGVMIMNLDELRSSGMDDVLINEINTIPHAYPDQDAINLLCAGRIVPIPLEYNVMSSLLPDFPHSQIRIKHFASEKPLWKSSLWQSYRRMSWDSVMNTQHNLHDKRRARHE